jgi:hypothetical protein
MFSRFVGRAAACVAAAIVGFAARTSPVQACSLCHCGDPTYALVGSQIFVPQAFRVGLDVDRYAKDQISTEDPTLREEEVENRATLSAAYSVHRRVTLVARLPFAERTITTGAESASITGLSDPEFLVHYRVLPFTPGSWFSITAGVRTGWGQNDRQKDGERAEEHLQPGTGAAGLSAGLSFSRLALDGSVFGSLSGRANGRNDFGYHYGNALLANLAYEHSFNKRLNGVLELNFRTAESDEESLDEKDPNTGGSVLYLSPRVLLKLGRDLYLRFGVQVPVAKGLHGDQDEKVNVQTGLTVRL